ncbi:hypothetical protein PE36_19365 [Moritella sp. PE36]|nr:hypothetical protein PE36_19365 [Moritella sp. PE36]
MFNLFKIVLIIAATSPIIDYVIKCLYVITHKYLFKIALYVITHKLLFLQQTAFNK